MWTPTHEEAFQALKQALTSAPVLAMPDFQKPFVIETDASDKGIGAVLHQENHSIAYVSRALGPKNQGLSTYEKECLAILLAVDHWRHYLVQAEFENRTDQCSLAHLDDQLLHTPWQQKALTKLLGLQYKITYKQGAENKAADALSRKPHDGPTELLALSMVQPLWFQEVMDGYMHHPATSKLLAALSVTSPQGNFVLKDGLIRYKNRIWVDGNVLLQNKIYQTLHAGAMGGHSGFQVTYQKIKHMFA